MRLDPTAERGELEQAGIAEHLATPLEDPSVTCVDEEEVRVHRTRDEPLPQPADRVDRRAAARAGDRIGGEEDASDIGVDHALDDDGEPHCELVDPMRRAVRDGSLVEQRGPTPAHGVEDGVVPFDVEDRVLLTREARVGQILSRRG